MSGPPMVKSMNFAEPEDRPVLGPAGNKARSVELRKPILKPKSEKTRQSPEADKGKKSPAALQSPEITTEKIPSPVGFRRNAGSAASILRQRQPNLSLNASCSSDASTDSSHSRASTGRIGRRTGTSTPPLKKKQQCSPRGERIEKMEGNGKSVGGESEGIEFDGSLVKKDPSYAAFHDEEWGLPVHDDKKLFELLSFSTALAELTWPVILSKRPISGILALLLDVFLDFDPIAVSKLNDKKIATQGSPASSLLSELKLRAIIENARQICKIPECIVAGDDLRDKNEGITPKNEENPPEDLRELELVREIDDLNLSRPDIQLHKLEIAAAKAALKLGSLVKVEAICSTRVIVGPDELIDVEHGTVPRVKLRLDPDVVSGFVG
ncbi:DNA-3-methyladenine glycosylase 1 [Sesamum angolense]|uniref:DNA-3-methyladenine glycosylase 1 n=1 Tax=Sesamum angolense TaxID=2727404 RepID=A0AAE2C695_9LAMI|nr:DNA-3-methyladenine glycosylase 1 [Sesamum angolense]